MGLKMGLKRVFRLPEGGGARWGRGGEHFGGEIWGVKFSTWDAPLGGNRGASGWYPNDIGVCGTLPLPLPPTHISGGMDSLASSVHAHHGASFGPQQGGAWAHPCCTTSGGGEERGGNMPF